MEVKKVNQPKKFIKNLLIEKGIDMCTNILNNQTDNLYFSINITQMMWSYTTLEEIFPSVGYQLSYENFDGTPHKRKSNPSTGTPMTRHRSVLRMYHGLPIWLDMIPDTVSDNHHIATTGNYFLRTFRHEKFIDNMNLFIDRMIAYNNKKDKEMWGTINRANMCGRGVFSGFRDINIRKRRTFDDIFIPKKDKELLINSLDDFVNKRQWYIDNNIPYHFGILLYGEPGTGKSVITQAIAEHLKAKYNVLNGADIGWLEDSLSELQVRPDNESYSVLAIEDVDCFFTGNNNTTVTIHDNEIHKRKANLSSILNCMDGVYASDNIIYVLTTNHKEYLDPALIRPGRCDIQLEIKGVCDETFREFCMFHYKRYPDRTVNIRKNITFAELQTDVMRGYSIEQLIEKLEGKNDESIENGGTERTTTKDL